MHELTLAAGILDLVQNHVLPADVARVRAVRVRVGDLAGVVPDSLQFCFEAIVAGTPFAAASLAIERVAAVAECGACGCTTVPTKPRFVCPACGALGMALLSGEELQVVEVELDDAMARAS